MKIRRIQIRNYRCFDDFSITFPEYHFTSDHKAHGLNLHVILAPNMTGKSALLKAIRVGLASVLQKIKANIANQNAINIGYAEHRVIGNNPFSDLAREVEITLEASHTTVESGKKLYEWTRYKEDYSRVNTKTVHGYGDISRDVNEILNKAITDQKGIVPLLLFVGTEYIHQQKPLTDTLRNDGSIKQGYWYCLDDKSMESYVFEWFEQLYSTTVEQQRSELANEYYDTFASSSIETFRYAIKEIIPDIEQVDWIRDTTKKSNRYILAFKITDQGIRTYEMLSDGYRYLVLLVGELVTRATLLNKHIKSNLLDQLQGVVLIDEFGIHLHPSLQSEALSRLACLFPKVQFIVTTHSPLMVNGLLREQIHIINESSNGERYATHPVDDAIGLGIEGILKEMFGVATTLDKPTLKHKEEYKALLELKNTDQLTNDQEEKFKDLSAKLSNVISDPFTESESEPTFTKLVREGLLEQTKNMPQTDQSEEELKASVNSVINKILSQNGQD